MPQSFSNDLIHIVFSTKCRHPFLTEYYRQRLHAYLGTVLRSKKSFVYNVGGTEDHVHILCNLPRDISQSELIGVLKNLSSKWMKEQGSKDFYWQKGYGVFSVSQSHSDRVKAYIEHQMEHHRVITFQEEFLSFLQKTGLQYDERYIWD